MGHSEGFGSATEEQHALAGVRVLDLTKTVAGAVAGMLLADLGADVVKVHPPGAAAPPGFAMWDRGKRAVTADPSSADDLRALDQLIAGADVLLVGTDGPGVTYRDLIDRGRRPGEPCFWMVMPPYLLEEAPWPGGEESAGLLFAWLGHAWNQSSYDDVPVDCLFPLALHMQGIWAALVAVGLLTGRQRGLALAPLAVAGGAHGAQLVSPGNFAAGRDEPHVHRPGGPGGTLPNYRAYRCADGEWLFLGAFTNAFIERGLAAAGAGWIFEDPRVGGNPGNLRLGKNLTWVTRELEKVFATRPRDEWLDLLEQADCPAAPVNEPGAWLDHDQVRALGLRHEAVTDTGKRVVMPGPLIDLSRTPASVRGPAATSSPSITELGPAWPAAGTNTAGPVTAGPVTAAPTAQRDPSRRSSPPPGEAAPEPQPPLSGLRVLDLGTIIAGPYVGTLLADLGADVIKVERPPHGDEFRVAHGGRGGSSFEVYNRDQRSALLDLSGGDGRLLFDRLVGSADVVVDNFRAGVATRLGITHDQLAAINPAVVTVSISAFGETGPLGRRPGFDPIIQAMSGIMRAQGGTDQADSPVFLTVPINDVLAAGLAALGACAALLARTRLGRGQHVGVTLCAASCLLQSGFLTRSEPPAHADSRAQSVGCGTYPAGGRDFAGPGPLDRLYQTADGWVRLAATQDQLPALTDGGLAPAPGQVEPGDEVLATGIAALLAELPSAEAIARAHVAGAPAVLARQGRELTGDSSLIEHGLLTIVDRDDDGVTWVGPGRWLEMPGLAAREPRDAPAAGEHTDTIRREVSPGS